ncbi:MAG: aminotransferase class V-fold PLP-dependent enzyme [Acidobacteriota bacterium]
MPAANATRFDGTARRADFPALLEDLEDGRRPIYLDSAATTLMPNQVLTAIDTFHRRACGSVGRSVHHFSREGTRAYQRARATVARFVGGDEHELVFTRNTTEAIHLVATGHPAIRDARVLTTLANHHSALLPWTRGDRVVPPVHLHPDGTLDLDDLDAKLGDVDLLVLPAVVNALGLRMPIETVIERARRAGVMVLLDGAQAVPHMPIDVNELDIDFLVWSGHKMLAPLGIGVLWARREHLEAMSPVLLGGEMVERVWLESDEDIAFEAKEGPARFEAGTPNVTGAVALATACEYLDDLGLENVHSHVSELAHAARRRLRALDGIAVHGPATDDDVATAVTFGFPGMRAHALALMLSNRFGIMVRSGHHCAEPLHQTLDLPPTVRASFYLYNDHDDVDALADALATIRQTL